MVLDLILVNFFSVPNFDWSKNVVISGVDNSSLVHIDNMKKVILVLGKGPTQGLHDTTIRAEAEYVISFSRSQRKFCSSLHYNGSNSCLFVLTPQKYINSKHSEIKPYPLSLGNISNDFTANNMKKNRIKWICLRFFR